MLMTVHAIVGAAIGQQVDNIYLSFIIGFLSHFVLDLIPHGDSELIDGYYKKEKVRKMIGLVVIDAIAMAVLILLLFSYKSADFTNKYSVIFGILGSILPDFIVGIAELSKKHFQNFYRFHTQIHTYIKKINPTLFDGVIMQIIVLLLLMEIL